MRQILEQQQRVHKNVAFGMEFRRLLHALHRRNFRQDFAQQAGLVEQQKGLAGVAFGKHFGQFIAHPLTRDLTDSAASFWIAAKVAGSMVYPKRAAKRTARSMRSLSSAKRSSGSPMVRMIPASRSLRPPTKSSTSFVDGIEQQAVDGEVAALDIFLRDSC